MTDGSPPGAPDLTAVAVSVKSKTCETIMALVTLLVNSYLTEFSFYEKLKKYCFLATKQLVAIM